MVQVRKRLEIALVSVWVQENLYPHCREGWGVNISACIVFIVWQGHRTPVGRLGDP